MTPRRSYRGEDGAEDPKSCLPSEAQWEYAARGDPDTGRTRGAMDRTRRIGCRIRSASWKGATYRADTLPMADVSALLGMSPLGLHHMAGNVWQWCRDWYDAAFYARDEAARANPVRRGANRPRCGASAGRQ